MREVRSVANRSILLKVQRSTAVTRRSPKKFRKKVEEGSFEFGIVPSCSVRDAIQPGVIQVEINISPDRFAYPASNNGVDVIVLGAVSRPVTTTVKY